MSKAGPLLAAVALEASAAATTAAKRQRKLHFGFHAIKKKTLRSFPLWSFGLASDGTLRCGGGIKLIAVVV